MKYYVVKRGRKTGIFKSWIECEEQVKGFPNASFKSFKSIDEAKKYYKVNDDIKEDIEDNLAIAYVDGSYDNNIKTYGYGVIIFYKNEKKIISGSGNEKELANLRNVAGEVKAAIKTIEYAIENKIKSLNIYYDYLGIEKWFTGEWKSNTSLTKQYSDYANKIKKLVNIKFIKVKAHSGNKYNEEVDKIAKDAVYNNIKEEPIITLKSKEKHLKGSKVKNGRIEPCFNIVKDGVILNDTASLMNKFKEQWKKEKRILNKIQELKIELNLSKNEVIFDIKIDNKQITKKIDMGDID